MSCWICPEAMIRYLVEAHHQLVTSATFEASDHLGQLLWEENYRYNESEVAPAYRHLRLRKPLSLAQVIMTANSYDYQSCEHDGWVASEAKKVITAIIDRAAWKLAKARKPKWCLGDEDAPANPRSRPAEAYPVPIGLAHARNVFGPIDEGVRARIMALLENPSQTTWENAFSIIIDGTIMGTLWDAVCRADPTFAQSKDRGKRWDHIPDRELLVRAINEACLPATAQEKTE